MIVQRQPDEITVWNLVFFTRATYRLARFVPGRFKHVAAFGYSHACRTWVIYDVGLAGTRVYVLPDGPAGVTVISNWSLGSSILLMPKANEVISLFGRLGFWCVPAMKHLIGIRSGAVLPDQLWRSCLHHGAQIVHDGRQSGTTTRPYHA